ncbi:hypothetical protein BV22DRAFT_967802, partial [Leucogyrophana mollusca]
KVPAPTDGRPDVLPENLSPLSEKIADSAVIFEFTMDAYPGCDLLPKYLVLRA